MCFYLLSNNVMIFSSFDAICQNISYICIEIIFLHITNLQNDKFMRRLITLTAFLVVVSLGAFAQDKKTWDFTKGLSTETVDNLNADEANWKANGTDADGNTNNWQNAVKPSPNEELSANGMVIKETAGLLFDIGNNKANSIHIAQNKIRLTRANTTITFPKLKNGQKVTIVGRSANGSATDRGISPVQEHIKFVSGELTNDACIFLGNQVEGSLGTYSFTWQIETSETDPVDVQFKLTPNAGIDFTLFMIDEGDAAVTANVAYLYAPTGNDDILAALQARENTTVTTFDVTEKVDVAADVFKDYDVTVLAPSIPVGNTLVSVIKEAMPWTPVLNLNPLLYAAWGYGEEVAQEMPIGIVTDRKNALLNGVELIEVDGMYIVELSGEPVTGVNLGEYFGGDATPIVAGDTTTPLAHIHNAGHNSYIYLPGNASPTPTMLQIIDNAITILQDSKSEISKAPAPNISFEYKDQNTNVTITPSRNLPKTRLFYTIDGTDPTEESTEYTGVINLTSPTTVKAVAIAEGYLLSDATSQDIDIKAQPKTPQIFVKENEGSSIITITCETEDADVWYNFISTTDTIVSSKYAEPITINMPATITAFSVAGGAVWSEVAEQRVYVKNPRVVIDVAGHFRAAKWENLSNGAGLFSWGKSAASMYEESEEDVTVVVDPETGEETIVYGKEKEYETIDEPGETPAWVIMSKGQSVLWQSNTPSTAVIGSNEGGYYPATAEDIDELFPVTNYDIQFYKIQGGEPANAAIQSKGTYQAPLDVVTIANMQGGPILVQVSADGENWTTIGEEIAATGYTRMWKKYTNSYDGTDEVYVRVAQETGSLGAKIFDIYVANAGEESQKLLDEINSEYAEHASGIEEVSCNRKQGAAPGIYNLGGVRQSTLQRGINIVVNGDGTVKKVIF